MKKIKTILLLLAASLTLVACHSKSVTNATTTTSNPEKVKSSSAKSKNSTNTKKSQSNPKETSKASSAISSQANTHRQLTEAEKSNDQKPISTEPIKNSTEAVAKLTKMYGNLDWKVEFDSTGKSVPVYYYITANNGHTYYVFANGNIMSADGDNTQFKDQIKDEN